MTIQIEICRSIYVKDGWNIRFGDIKGSTEFCNFTKEAIIKEISDVFDEEDAKSVNSNTKDGGKK